MNKHTYANQHCSRIIHAIVALRTPFVGAALSHRIIYRMLLDILQAVGPLSLFTFNLIY